MAVGPHCIYCMPLHPHPNESRYELHLTLSNENDVKVDVLYATGDTLLTVTDSFSSSREIIRQAEAEENLEKRCGQLSRILFPKGHPTTELCQCKQHAKNILLHIQDKELMMVHWEL